MYTYIHLTGTKPGFPPNVTLCDAATHTYIHTHIHIHIQYTHTHIHTHMYAYMVHTGTKPGFPPNVTLCDADIRVLAGGKCKCTRVFFVFINANVYIHTYRYI